MWVLFYAMAGGLFSPDAMNNIGSFPSRNACEHVQVQIEAAFHPKSSRCVELQEPHDPVITPPPPAALAPQH